MNMAPPFVVISCEHAGNRVPEKYEGLFTKEALESHRGYDIGALSLAQSFQQEVIQNNVTRLLVDVNRSLHTETLFSYPFSEAEQEEIVQKYYIPHRNRVLKAVIEGFQHSKKVLHLSMHSFTPVMNGVERDVDIGLLFDPSRLYESQFCRKLSEYLQAHSQFKIRMNEPYLGISDGLTTTLRTLFPDEYMGVEIEVNQKFAKNGKMSPEIDALLRAGVAHAIQ